MNNLLWPALLTVGAGASALVQSILNANLRAQLESAAWSGVVSYFLGLVCMLSLAAVFGEAIPAAGAAARVPWWAWSGGIFGAIFVGLSMILIPKLGGGAFIALLVTGQMIAALAFDHFGWLGIPVREVDVPRLIGVALLVGGVVLIHK